MNRKNPSKLGPKGLEIVRMIDAREIGVSSAEIAKEFGLALNTVSQHLSVAKKLGLANWTYIGTCCPVWFTPRHAGAIEAELQRVKSAALQKRSEYFKDYKQVRKIKGKRPVVFEGRDTLPIRRSIIRATEAKPIRPKGPISVFHLGAA